MSPAGRFVALLVGAVAMVVPAGASAAVQPNGGSSFNSDTDGWTSTGTTCQPTGGAIGELCSATNSHDAGFGDPAGSLRSRLSLDTGLLLFNSGLTWRSPSFAVPGDPGVSVDGAEFAYGRRFGAGALINVGPEAEIDAVVVDETAGGQVELTEEALDANDSSFEARNLAVVPGALTGWHQHHIELHASIRTTSTGSGVSGSSDVHFDNVSLGIPDPPGNTPGVTFPGPPKTDAEIAALMLSLNLNALVGDGPGGSQVPHDQCTILGTSGADRIRGTTGNDVACGLGGNDRITGRKGRDVIDTGDGDDRATGSQGGDLILGSKGKDLLKGKKGKDKIGGGTDRDRLLGHGNKDAIAARDGKRDLVNGGASHGDRARVDRKDRVRHVE